MVRLSCGVGQCCAVDHAGSLSCFGANNRGQLGDGTTTDRNVPAPVVGLASVRTVTCGDGFCCAADLAGIAWCWGRNNTGNLGNGTTGVDQTRPVRVLGATDTVKLGLGASHTCAQSGVTSHASCWGLNNSGQIGDGTMDARLDATTVRTTSEQLYGVQDLTTAGNLACVIHLGGRVSCWGTNRYRQINASRQDSPFATPITGITGMAHLTVGPFPRLWD